MSPPTQPGYIMPSPEERGQSARTTVMWSLFLGGYVVLLTPIFGIIMAYLNRKKLVGTVFESHIAYAIRTFWITIAALVAAAVLALAVAIVTGAFDDGTPPSDRTIYLATGALGAIGLAVVALNIWFIYRCGRGMICALDSRPISNPKSLL